MRRRLLLAGTAATLAAPGLVRAQDQSTLMREFARRAAIFLFPVYEMYRTRWNATVNEANPSRQRLNRFLHVPTLATDRTRAVTTPNNDTLYSSAWLELSAEPMFLTLPPMGELFYSYAFIDMFTNNFAYVSHRLNGGMPGPHVIVGPGWKGDLPSDVTPIRAPTNSVWLLGRILVDGPEDLPAVRAMQVRALLETPDQRNERRILEVKELMRTRTVSQPEPVAEWPAPNPADPFDLFDVGMRVMGEQPKSERDRVLLEEFEPLKLLPGRKFDARAFSEPQRQAIRAGIADAQRQIGSAGPRFGRVIDGWSYGEKHLGNFGDDYLYRAQVALSGLAALTPEEAMYMSCQTDSEGRPLTGQQNYTLTLPPGGAPPAKAFWSLAMYELTPEGRAFFTDNPLDRYAIGDRTPGLVQGADGSITLYLQRNRPEGDKAANWLPAPAGPMRLVMRAYQPDRELLDGRYRVPPVRRVS